jgi:hypothetical protein
MVQFREKAREIRKKFSRGSSSTAGGTTTDVSNAMEESTRHTTHTPYRPGERIPYKYRRPVEKKHKETLEAFTFADAWNERRKSFASQYSPMGSRLPSCCTSRRNSIDFQRGLYMRRGDVGQLADTANEESAPSSRESSRTRSYVNSFADIPTVGISRTSTDPISFASSDDSSLFATSDYTQPRPRSRHDTQFSAEDLSLALKRSRLSS